MPYDADRDFPKPGKGYRALFLDQKAKTTPNDQRADNEMTSYPQRILRMKNFPQHATDADVLSCFKKFGLEIDDWTREYANITRISLPVGFVLMKTGVDTVRFSSRTLKAEIAGRHVRFERVGIPYRGPRVQNSRFLDLPRRRNGKSTPPPILNTIFPSYIVAPRGANPPAPEPDISLRQGSIPPLDQRQGSYAKIVRGLPKDTTTQLVSSSTVEPQSEKSTLVEDTIHKADSPQRINTLPISKLLSRTSTPQKSDSPQRANTALRGELSARFTTPQDATLPVPNHSRPLVPPHLLKQSPHKPPEVEIQRVSLTELFKDSTADCPRSSRSYQSHREAVDDDERWSQQITDTVNNHRRPANAVRSWNIASRDPSDRRYNFITEADWNTFQFKKDSKKEKM